MERNIAANVQQEMGRTKMHLNNQHTPHTATPYTYQGSRTLNVRESLDMFITDIDRLHLPVEALAPGK